MKPALITPQQAADSIGVNINVFQTLAKNIGFEVSRGMYDKREIDSWKVMRDMMLSGRDMTKQLGSHQEFTRTKRIMKVGVASSSFGNVKLEIELEGFDAASFAQELNLFLTHKYTR